MKGKDFAFKSVWNESHIFLKLPYTPILLPYKDIRGTFLRGVEDMQDSLEKSELKRDFFFLIKHPQVKFYLVRTYFGLGL